MRNPFKIMRAEGCAWRGRYFYFGHHQLGRVILDPADGKRGPNLCLAFPVGWRRTCAGLLYPRLLQVRIPLPHLRWKYPASRPRMWLYQLSQRFWCGMDGRYGWKAQRRKEHAEQLEKFQGVAR